MSRSQLPPVYKLLIPALTLTFLFSCKQNIAPVRSNEDSSVKDTVLKLAYSTAKDISAKGPKAWLNYFEDSPDFYMASDGVMAFNNYHSADTFINNKLVKQLQSINLQWSAIRIKPLSGQFASMGAKFHEDLRDTSGRVNSFDGYFTATAHQTPKGWKYLNVHWSIKKGK
jgi:hypothetical protein